MGRQGWVRPGWNRVGAPLSLGAPGVGGITRYWDPTKWYPAVDWLDLLGSGLTGLQYAGGMTLTNIRSAQPFTFDRAGTITAIGTHVDSNNTRVFMGVYSSASGNPQSPGAKNFSVEKVAPGFHQPLVATGLTIAVTAGETKWFATIFDRDCACFSISPPFVRTEGGTDWDGVTAGVPAVRFVHGYRTNAGAYADLPDPWPGTDALWKSNNVNSPHLMMKFTPS